MINEHNKKAQITNKKKNNKQTKIILVRRFGDREFAQLYSTYVAGKILSKELEEKKNNA